MLRSSSHLLPSAPTELHLDLYPADKILGASSLGKMHCPERKIHKVHNFSLAHFGQTTHERCRYQPKWGRELRMRKTCNREMQKKSSKWWLWKSSGWQPWPRQRRWPAPIGKEHKTPWSTCSWQWNWWKSGCALMCLTLVREHFKCWINRQLREQ